MNKGLIDRYITLPMAINVFKKDQERFKKFKMRGLYLDLLDAAIDKASQDFYELKGKLISENHLDVKKIGRLQFSVNGDVVEYSAEELKGITSQLMSEYLTVDFERKQRVWV